ncbi:nucleoside 2-deoxyribosyltransferase [Paenibacillus zanthoxyli]|uniref:nucleoside 2-deoxyribosyltransferase n=1 Tax=Paenibacillus zanthoxyli TaxID=369399 RepID=UPI0004B21845|nr:nucleoside 2-deoxyribosyltransferase [Paenibacillus zanthoxyli]
MAKHIYLAGFEVFYPDAMEIGARLKASCEEHGFVGIFPKDNMINKQPGCSKSEIASDIFQANLKLIEQADIVAANLNCFRGSEPDSGTVFEVGYAYAKGQAIYGYLDKDIALWEKVALHWGGVQLAENGRYVDKDGMFIEDLGLPLNLMLGIPVNLVIGPFEACIKQIQLDQAKA